MIGHYLLTLCPDAEEAILTGRLKPGAYGTETERCLVGWAADVITDIDGDHTEPGRHWNFLRTQYRNEESIENRFDELCERVGTDRAASLIRERILANIARRELASLVYRAMSTEVRSNTDGAVSGKQNQV